MRKSNVISKFSSEDLSNHNRLSSLHLFLTSVVESPDQYISSLDNDDCHIYYKGSLNDIEAISICSTDGINDKITGAFYQNLSIALVWVKPCLRGTGYAKEFFTDVGYSLGKEIASNLESRGVQSIHLESFAECRNQAGYNCCFWLSQLFAAAFQLYELSPEVLIKSFTTTFPDAQEPEPY